jgi:SAM-dependent methyltransferase
MTEPRPDPDPADWADPSPTYDVVADRYAAKFLDELSHKPFDRDLLDRFAGDVLLRATAERPVCDLGCGPGHIGGYLAERGVPVIGIDLSTAMVLTAQRAFPDLTFAQGDMTALDRPDGCFAGIACFYAIIHLPRVRVPAALGEMRRTLVDGGALLLAAHGGTGSLHADEMLEQPVSLDATLFSLDELTAMVQAAGCTIVEAYERPPYEDELATPRLYVWASTTGN